jgi:hypothetical protein
MEFQFSALRDCGWDMGTVWWSRKGNVRHLKPVRENWWKDSSLGRLSVCYSELQTVWIDDSVRMTEIDWIAMKSCGYSTNLVVNPKPRDFIVTIPLGPDNIILPIYEIKRMVFILRIMDILCSVPSTEVSYFDSCFWWIFPFPKAITWKVPRLFPSTPF